MLKAKSLRSPEQRRVLITRPLNKSNELAFLLRKHQIVCLTHPLIKITSISSPNPQLVLSQAGIIIAVSDNAVYYAAQQIEQWPSAASYFAVGEKTKQQFEAIHVTAQSPQKATSEGLLQLSSLVNVKGERVVIIRGNGGREHLAQQLIQRGAKVSYLEVYQRQLVSFSNGDSVMQWQQHRINTIVVTSAEILHHLYNNIGESNLSWLQDLCLVVPSERIAKIATFLGAKRVELSHGADNQSILNILLN